MQGCGWVAGAQWACVVPVMDRGVCLVVASRCRGGRRGAEEAALMPSAHAVKWLVGCCLAAAGEQECHWSGRWPQLIGSRSAQPSVGRAAHTNSSMGIRRGCCKLCGRWALLYVVGARTLGGPAWVTSLPLRMGPWTLLRYGSLICSPIRAAVRPFMISDRAAVCTWARQGHSDPWRGSAVVWQGSVYPGGVLVDTSWPSALRCDPGQSERAAPRGGTT
jgi:hypothetical protein